ncbi:MAG: efflux RND transporter periplasmic adaptor subunit [Pirellulaceae bacterium]|nr:efflux RND transporter periplasmic adaptor subunit [Pirellulaceae bacterium]
MSITESRNTNSNERRKSRWTGVVFAFRMVEVRLRFIAILVGLGLVIGYWDAIENYWDRFTRPTASTGMTSGTDSEYYCPMDPAVIRDGLEPNGTVPKCGICGMPLSLRKKGSPTILPPGIVGRVTLTANKVRMAGIRTSEISLRPMVQTIRTVGNVDYEERRRQNVVSRFGGYVEKLLIDKTFVPVSKGDPVAEIYSPELFAAAQELKIASEFSDSQMRQAAREKIQLLGVADSEIDAMLQSNDRSSFRMLVRSPASGIVIKKMIQQGSTITAGQVLFEVVDISIMRIEADVFERDLSTLHLGQSIVATIESLPNREFSGKLGLIYPELNRRTRTNRVQFELDNEDGLLRSGMFASIRIDTAVQDTELFHELTTTSTSKNTDPEVAIAKQKVCPVTGAKLGSMGKPLPVDIEGRTVFICCAGCEKKLKEDPKKFVSRIETVTDTEVLSVPETAVIDTGDQKIVYIEREENVFEGVEVQLGPRADGYYAVVAGLLPGDKVAAAGAFLIDAETRLNPSASASYFGASGNASNSSGSSSATLPMAAASTGSKEKSTDTVNFAATRLTDVELAELAKLNAAEQLLAKLQVLCPVTMEPLGSMGTPFSVKKDNESVFICCEGCRSQVEASWAESIAMVRRWRESNAKAIGTAK